MRVPIAWLREYVDLPADPQRVAEMLAQIGFPVDAVEERPLITGVVIGRIAQLEKHPNADRLQVGKIDVGNGAPLTIATAATNVAQGQTIAVATIGAQLPQITIERRKMRGVESEGMMISAEELALPGEWFEDGIMQFDHQIALGTNLVEHFHLNDAVLEVDITSNRVDALSMIGLARELAAYQGVPLRSPALAEVAATLQSDARVSILSQDCRFFALAQFGNVRVGLSPAWMRIRLALAGQRPINNLVDISNYVMLETGQPTHFYDADKMQNHHLIVRDGNANETLLTLDGSEHELSPKDLVIADESGAQGLAGLMGGASSEVTESTTGILLEAAAFTGSRVRRMSTRHALRTEASTRHEKSLSTSMALAGAKRAAALLVAAGAAAGPLLLEGTQDTPAVIEFPITDVQRLLGFSLSAQEIREYLDRLGFSFESGDSHRLRVIAPPWRRDVTIPADVVEEIARMAGYDRIEAVIPAIRAHEVPSNDYLLEQRTAHALSALGYHEIMTYALHGARFFERLAEGGVEPSSTPVEVLNPLSEDQRYLRYALGPAHLEYLARLDAPFKFFEIGHVFYIENGEPMEVPMLSFGFAADPLDEPDWRDSHFLRLKGDAEQLLHALTGGHDFEFVADTRNGLHPGKTASVLLDGREIAFLGQTNPRVTQAFGVRRPVYVSGIYFERIPDYRSRRYRAPSKYPSTYRDLALLCEVDLPAATLERETARAIGELCNGVHAFDEYRGPQVPAGKKSLALRATLQKNDGTITDEEADAAIEKALSHLREHLDVALRA